MSRSTHTHPSRRPSRVVGYMRSRLSLSYAMAGTLISRMNLDGLLQQAGLSISKE